MRNHSPNLTQKSKGFTLIELLVVIAIIGLLAAVVFASLNTARAKARDARRLSDIKQLQLALDLYFHGVGNGQYPPANATCGFNATAACGLQDDLVANGYISTIPHDPRETVNGTNDYRYQTNAGNGYSIILRRETGSTAGDWCHITRTPGYDPWIKPVGSFFPCI